MKKKRKIIKKKKIKKPLKVSKIKRKGKRKFKKKIKKKSFKNISRKKPKKRPFTKLKTKRTKKTKKNIKETFRKLIRLSDKLRPNIKFRFSLDKFLLNFFQNISNKIETFKQVLQEEREKKKMEKIRLMHKEKIDSAKKLKLQKDEEFKKRLDDLKAEEKLQKHRKYDLKKFIKFEQALVRKEQAERQRKFYEKIKLEKKIEQFRKREALEIQNLEKFVLNQERENYSEVQERIEKIKQKYQAIREQKIRERIESLGIDVSDSDTRVELLEKERQFNLAREKIENTLESFYRSMASCVYQLNKKWLPKKMSLLRVIDRRYETSEIFIKSDEESDDNWLMLVYLKDNNPYANVVVEDKSNTEKNISTEYKPNEIFKFSDSLVDSLTSMIDREFRKKLN